MRRTKWFWTAVAGMVLLGGVLTGCQSEEEKEEDGAIVEGTVLVGWKNPKGKIRVPDGVTDIAEDALANRSEITSVVIPSSVVNINKGAFYNCTGLRNVEIQGIGLEIIGEGAFHGDTGLVSIMIPDSVTSIGHNAFADCKTLTMIKIPDSVVTIGEWAFASCTALRTLTIGNSVTSLGKRAFEYCASLINVTIPNSVMTIYASVFCGCDKLTTVNISGEWQAEREGIYMWDVGTITVDMLKDNPLGYDGMMYRRKTE